MTDVTLSDLQASVQDRGAFHDLSDYIILCSSYLRYLEDSRPTRIVSPSHHNYVFYQYDEMHHHRITRPLNIDLFIENEEAFRTTFDRFAAFLDDLKRYHETAFNRPGNTKLIQSNESTRLFIQFSNRLVALVILSIILINRENALVSFSSISFGSSFSK